MTYQQKERQVQAIAWIIKGRWIILIGAGSLGFIQKAIGASSIHLSSVAIGIILLTTCSINAFYQWSLRRGVGMSDRELKSLSVLQIAVDQIVYTIVIFYSGGIESLSFVFYILPILSATVLYRTAGIMMFAFVNVLMYLGLLYLELVSVIPHQPRYTFDPGIYGNPGVTISNALLVVATIFLAAIFTTFISRMLRSREGEITAERDKVMSMLRRFPDGVVMLDPDLRISFINSRAKEMMQLGSWDHLIGRAVTSNLVSRVMKDLIPALRKKVREEGEASEEVNVGAGTDRVIFRVSSTPLVDGRGQSLGMMKVIHDVTREREIDRMKSEFISIAAHQLRTPLSAVKWVLKMMMDGDMGKMTGEQKQFLAKGYQSNERMINLVNDLLSVSRMEEGRFLFEFEMTDVAEIIRSVIAEADHSVKEKKLNIDFHRPAKALPPAYADPLKLRLVVQNLVDNAIRYTPSGGSVDVSCRLRNEMVEVAVADTGLGIPKAQQRKLFTKFFRASNVVKVSPDGTGLGLFIVRNIIRKHGGEIAVVSDEGKGATFTFTVPIKKGQIPHERRDEAFEQFMESF